MACYQSWMTEWNEMGERIRRCGGEVSGPVIQPPASEAEVAEVERQLGRKLPAGFRRVVLEFSRGVEFSWDLPEEVRLPEELSEISCGALRWNLDGLSYMEELEYEDDEQEDGEYEDEDETEFQNLLSFAQVENGDILAFHMDEENPGAVVYWSHEGAGTFRLAGDFAEYVTALTALGCVGQEIWQLEMFLAEERLNPKGEMAKTWCDWLETFARLSKGGWRSLDEVLEFVEMRGIITEEALAALGGYPPDQVRDGIVKRLGKDSANRDVLYWALAEAAPEAAAEQARLLWRHEDREEPVLRSYVTAISLPVEEGLALVTAYINKMGVKESWEVAEHLSHFADSRVIDCIKPMVGPKATKDDWYSLFAQSQPRWDQLEEWLALGGKHRMVAVRALEFMTTYGAPETPEGEYRYRLVADLPVTEIKAKLLREKEAENLQGKKAVFQMAAECLEKLVCPSAEGLAGE